MAGWLPFGYPKFFGFAHLSPSHSLPTPPPPTHPSLSRGQNQDPGGLSPWLLNAVDWENLQISYHGAHPGESYNY